MSRMREIEKEVTAQMAAEGAEMLRKLEPGLILDPVRRAIKCYAVMAYMRERQKAKTFKLRAPVHPAISQRQR